MRKEEITERFGLDKSSDFYITAPSPCPYIPGRKERKVFSFLGGENAALVNSKLTQRGFRRSQNIIYVPSCDKCSACVAVRIRNDGFELTKSQKRILKRNEHLERRIRPARATSEQFSVLRSYLDHRHNDGGMSGMTVLDYSAMVEETSVDTMIIEYWQVSSSGREQLIAAALTDRLDDGISMVYSYFDPDFSNQSLGRFMILDHITLARELKLPHVYLGYWVAGSPKMHYKSEFQSLEKLTRNGWTPLDNNK